MFSANIVMAHPTGLINCILQNLLSIRGKLKLAATIITNTCQALNNLINTIGLQA